MNLMQRPSAVEEMFARRAAPTERLCAGAEAVTRTSYSMAQRFRRGGKLIVFGNGGASTDAQHVAVEFVHPVIVGKRALPAMALTCDIATVTGMANQAGYAGAFAHQIGLFAGGGHDHDGDRA
jgi:D-sedoheptulose 7-phosphate isomerase